MTSCRSFGCTNYSPRAEELCDPCEEYRAQRHREDYGYQCIHCGKTYAMLGGFNRHKFQIYYREGWTPMGHKVRI